MIRFVLLRPRIAENVGAAARVLKNFGWSNWAVIEPAFDDWGPARRMAVQSEDVLDGASRPTQLSDAISDCTWVVGTSSRRRRGQRHLSPRDFAAEAIRRTGHGTVGLVFGDERSGLTNDVLDRCHDVSTVATDEAQPSINLAQAICLYSYELRLAAEAAAPREEGALPRSATAGMIEALHAALQDALTQGRFLHDTRAGVLEELLAPLVRSRLTRKEAELWNSALRALAKRLRGPP